MICVLDIRHNIMKKLLLLAIASTFSAGAWADCEAANKKPSSLVACYEEQSYSTVLSHLNTLRKLSKEQLSYNPNIIKELDKSQSAWLAYRDSYCDTYSNYHTEAYNHSNCIINLNNQRAEQLQQDIDAN